MNENERKNNGRSETMKGSRLMKETMGKWTKIQWEISNNGRIKMNERNNGKINENTMGDQ
jgi:hypothetical protein